MMRQFRTVFVILLALSAPVVLGAQEADAAGQEEPDAAQPASETVSGDLSVYLEPQALRDLLAADLDDVYLVDVRTATEYEAGHIPGAIHRDYRLFPFNPPVDDRDAVLVLYCRTGSLSRTAEMMLEAMGYERVLDWGGIVRWPYEIATGSSPDDR